MELPFKTQELNNAWNEWLQDRKERKLKKYTERGLKAAISHLQAISGNDEQTAIQIINQSIAQGWQGLFPLKQLNNGKFKNNTQTDTSRPDSVLTPC